MKKIQIADLYNYMGLNEFWPAPKITSSISKKAIYKKHQKEE